MNVLIAIAEPETRQRALQGAARAGRQATCVIGAEELLEQIRSVGPHLIVFDGDAFDEALSLCQHVRDLSGGGAVALVALVSVDHPDRVSALLEAGASDYLLKPVEPALLDARLRFAERLLATAEGRYRLLLEQASDGVFIADGAGRFVEVNLKACEMAQYGRKDLLEMSLAQIFHDEDVPADAPRIALIAERVTIRQHALRRKDGTLLPVEVSAKLLPDGRTQAIARDITDRKRAEARIARLNRLLSVLSRTNEAIVRAHDRDELFRSSCAIAVEQGHFDMAWIGLVDERGEVRPAARAGRDDGYLSAVRISVREDEPEGCGTTGSAIRNGTCVVCDDLASDESMRPWAAEALRCGFRTEASFPLRLETRVIGALVLHAGEPGIFQPGELRILQDLADDLSFAIDSLEQQARRRRTEDELRARVEQQAIVAELGRRALASFDLAPLFNDASALVAGSLDVRLCGIFELAPGEGVLRLRAGVGWSEKLGQGSPIPLFGSLRQTLDGHPRPAEPLASSGDGLPQPLRDEGAACGIEVVLQSTEGLFGALGAFASGPRAFTDDDVLFLRAVAQVLAMAVDRTRADEALGRSEMGFRALVEQSPDAIVVHRDGRLIYVNPAMNRYLGFSGPELVGRSFLDLVHPEEISQVEAQLEALRRGEALQSVERRFRRNDGLEVLAEVIHHAVEWHGEPAVAAVIRDVTERKQMQATLLLTDRLASVGTLAAGVAHEINNPLAYVAANLTYALGELPGASRACREAGGALAAVGKVLDEVVQALQDAKEGADRVSQIVRDLKSFSRADDLRRGPVDVRHVLDTTIKMAGNEIRHRAQLRRDFGEVPLVVANEARLGQVFLNLLVNAAQALPGADPARHEIRVTTSTDPSGRAAVEVSDTGNGIPPEIAGRIFDPFFTTKPVGVGTGLGLSICHGIVTGLGGEIAVRSELGKGTTFRVVLPPAAEGLPVPAPVALVAPAPRRGRILVVDDEPLIGASIQRALGREHEVVVVESARLALERLAAGERFDLVLCDLMMPQMTGMELHAELVRLAPELARAMVFMSGGAFTPNAQAFLEQVANVRLEKPFDLERLRALVRDCLLA